MVAWVPLPMLLIMLVLFCFLLCLVNPAFTAAGFYCITSFVIVAVTPISAVSVIAAIVDCYPSLYSALRKKKTLYIPFKYQGPACLFFFQAPRVSAAGGGPGGK